MIGKNKIMNKLAVLLGILAIIAVVTAGIIDIVKASKFEKDSDKQAMYAAGGMSLVAGVIIVVLMFLTHKKV